MKKAFRIEQHRIRAEAREKKFALFEVNFNNLEFVEEFIRRNGMVPQWVSQLAKLKGELEPKKKVKKKVLKPKDPFVENAADVQAKEPLPKTAVELMEEANESISDKAAIKAARKAELQAELDALEDEK